MPINKWTEAETQVLERNQDLDSHRVMELLPGRTYYSVVQKRRQTGLQWSEKQRWDEWEIKILRDFQHLSAIALAETVLPTRKPDAIKYMRSVVKLPHTVRCCKCGVSMVKGNQFDVCNDCKKDVNYHNHSMLGKYRQYKHGAKRRGYVWDLSIEDFAGFWDTRCFYCGSKIVGVGVDRVDNLLGYTVGNCVSCCETCNQMKLDYNKDEWLEHMKKIIRHMEGEQ